MSTRPGRAEYAKTQAAILHTEAQRRRKERVRRRRPMTKAEFRKKAKEVLQ